MSKRIEILRENMGKKDYDAFFSLSAPANEYLTGFRGSTSALLITPRAALLLCDFRYTEQAREQARGCEVREVAGAIELRLAEQLQEAGAKRGTFDGNVLTVAQSTAITKTYTGALCEDSALLTQQRQVKDAEEIQKLRNAAVLGESELAALLGDLQEGVTEREFAARLEYGFKQRGASGASFPSIVLYGEKSSLPHGVPGERALSKGDIVLIDSGCVRESYCSDLTRTFVFSTIPGAWFEEIYKVTLDAQLAALEAVRPGKTCREVDAVARDIIRDAGYGDYFGHGLGHGVGLEIHEAPRLNMHTETVLEAGMAITIEPGIYLPGRGGVRIEDLVIVTENGCERLTTSSKELRVLGA